MKIIGLLLIAVAAMFVTTGCEEEHEHHGHYGGAYDGAYRGYGHDDWRGYPAYPVYRDHDWR